MLFIWEEEKTGRDLYTAFYEKDNQSIFLNLVRSEQNHMDQAKAIIDKYGLQAAILDEPGVLLNQTLREIYDRLLGRGLNSDQDALRAAATFEEISIMDLTKELAADPGRRRQSRLSGTACRIKKASALALRHNLRIRKSIRVPLP